jgi:hypothetical protein
MSLLFTVQIFAANLGININFAERGGTFVDVAKEEYRWSKAGDGGELSTVDVDEHGWPNVDARFVVDYRPVAEWNNSIDDPAKYRIDVSGTYKCSFTGSGEIRGVTGGTVQNKLYNDVSNTTTFDFVIPGPPGDNHGLIIIDFTNTKRFASGPAGSGFTNFRMLRPGYDLQTTKTFTDQFISALTGIKFSTIRFMNFTMTNGFDPNYPGITKWSNRKHKIDASQSTIPPLGKNDGGAWEYIIELCNLVDMDPWINIPVSADSEYVTEVAKLFKNNLEQSRSIYVESSNEVWNTAPGFEQSIYNQKQAEALHIGEHANHARRTVEIAKRFGQVFGMDALNNRVRVILCSHKPMLKWWVAPMLDTIEKAYGPPKNFIYAIACQTYFGGGITTGESVDKILTDCRNDIINQVDETGKTDEAGRKQWIKLASDRGLKGGFCSYEGGPDHGGGSTDNIANRILAERDQRMADIWTFNYDSSFFKIGGNLAMQFTLSSAYTRYGCWGLTDDINHPERNPKYNAAKSLAEKYPSSIDRSAKAITHRSSIPLSAISTDKGIRVHFTMQNSSDVAVSIWDINGKRVKYLKLGNQNVGAHDLTINDVKLTSSSHFLIIELKDSRQSKRCNIPTFSKR